MKRTLLYYPTINIPNDDWLRHAVVYWDQVSSIIPKSYNQDSIIQLSDDIKYLKDEGQFREIAPEDLIRKQSSIAALNSFQNEFRAIISSDEFKSYNSSFYNGEKNISLDNPKIISSKVHRDKISDLLFHFLIESGLAKNSVEEDNWLLFEQNTALVFMSVLAKYLAEVDSENTTIGTDIEDYEKFNFKLGTVKNDNPILNLNLKNVLPTPRQDVSFKKIVKFKNKRKDNLVRFQKTISEVQTKLSLSK